MPKLLLELAKMLPLFAAGLAYLIVSGWISDKRRRRILSDLAAAQGSQRMAWIDWYRLRRIRSLATWHILRRFEIYKVENILRGTVSGTEFAYFEQYMTAARGSIAFSGGYGSYKLSPYVQSVMAVAIPPAAHFAWEPADHPDIKAKRTGDWIYFWPPETQIAAKNVKSFLAQVFGLVQAGLKKYQNC